MRMPLLTLLAGLAVAGADLRAAENSGAGAQTLKQAFADDFLLGTAVNDDVVSGRDARAQALVLRHFNAVTLENSMKAEKVNPQPGVYNFAAADAFVDFGEKHGMFVVGHTLVWHNQTPDWFFFKPDGTPVGHDALVERMRQHIEKVAGRYAGRVDAWDVVNEQIGEDGQYRDTKWVAGIGDGDELLRLAFTFASRYAPDAELYYNDFNAWRPEKRDGIVRMVKMLQAHGIRIDGIGIQGHWGLDFPSTADIEAAIDAYAALGVKVMITEGRGRAAADEGRADHRHRHGPPAVPAAGVQALPRSVPGRPAGRRAAAAGRPLRRTVRPVPPQARQDRPGQRLGRARCHVVEERLSDSEPHQLSVAVRSRLPAQTRAGGRPGRSRGRGVKPAVAVAWLRMGAGGAGAFVHPSPPGSRVIRHRTAWAASRGRPGHDG